MPRARRTSRVIAALAVLALAAGAPSARAEFSTAPAGTNDFACRPTASHPRPVVMLQGLGGNGGGWSYMAPILLDAGYCLFTIDYGIDPLLKGIPYAPEGSIPMERSARELRVFVNEVLAATGARQVDIVGHSEGTVMPRYYMERLGGAPKVKRFVALTPLWRGSEVGGIPMLRDALAPRGVLAHVIDLFATFCAACTQVLAGSPYLNDLNADGEAIPGIVHTNIVSKLDELVVPYTSGIMRDGGTNIVLQDVCPLELSEHAAVAFSPVVAQLIVNALDPAHAAPVRC